MPTVRISGLPPLPPGMRWIVLTTPVGDIANLNNSPRAAGYGARGIADDSQIRWPDRRLGKDIDRVSITVRISATQPSRKTWNAALPRADAPSASKWYPSLRSRDLLTHDQLALSPEVSLWGMKQTFIQ